MDSAVQPILCCLGKSVGECPTQYLMELGFAAQHLDWRAITVEVQPDNLRAAMDGARAMGFRGLRFWGETQLLASDALGLDGLPVSSALATDSGWQAWHTDGYVLANLVKDELAGGDFGLDGGPLSIVLFGDRPQTRRIYGGLLNKYALPNSSQQNVQIDWIGIADNTFSDEPRLRTFESEEACLSAIMSEAAGKPIFLVGCTYQTAQLFVGAVCPAQSALDERNEQDTKSSETQAGDPAVEKNASASNPTAPVSLGPIWWLPSSEDVLTRPMEEVTAGTIGHISRTDLLLRGEVHDFTIWTGQSISLPMLRDAYDEFNAF